MDGPVKEPLKCSLTAMGLLGRKASFIGIKTQTIIGCLRRLVAWCKICYRISWDEVNVQNF